MPFQDITDRHYLFGTHGASTNPSRRFSLTASFSSTPLSHSKGELEVQLAIPSHIHRKCYIVLSYHTNHTAVVGSIMTISIRNRARYIRALFV